MQIFDKIDGYMVSDLKNASKYPNTPDKTLTLEDFNEQGSIPDESYGSRIFGFFKPIEDGQYTFYVCKFLAMFSLIVF